MHDAEQEPNIDRVAERIRGAIVKFCTIRLTNHPSDQFFMDDLRRFVESEVGLVAPDSPGRILRALRANKTIDYVVVSRAQSLYRVVSVGGT